MLKAVVFDLDQTLVDRAATFDQYLLIQFTDFNLSTFGIDPKEYFECARHWDNNGYTDKLTSFTEVVSHFNLAVSADDLFSHFKTHYGKEAFLFDGVFNLLGVLQKKYKLALVTNGRTKGQQTKIDVTKIGSFFDQILISEAEGIKKPDPEIFRRCCQRLAIEPSEAVFVGDHPHNDVVAAKNIGMKAIWVETENYESPAEHDGIVQSVVELLDLI